jgi:hypothetical protein
MRSLSSVTELRQRLVGRGVLSAYISQQEHDPAQRDTWRARLHANLAQAADHVPAADVAAFEQARDHLLARLGADSGVRPPASIGFVTARCIEFWTETPAQIADLVRWRRGPLLGPLLGGLSHERDLMIALVDSRRARLIDYRHGQLDETVDFRGSDYIDDLTDRNMSKRGGRFSGVRGETATDAADQILGLETERLLGTVADRIGAAQGDALVVIGGPPAASNALHRKLGERGVNAHLQSGLQLSMSLAELRMVIEPLLVVITERVQEKILREVLELAGGAVHAVLGGIGVSVAAQRGQVQTLLLTARAMQEHEDLSEDLIGWVLETAGGVEVLSGEPATLLDDAGGFAATLRYALRPVLATGSGPADTPG